MTDKVKTALANLVDAIMEERPSCVSADIHIEKGIARVAISEKDSISIFTKKGGNARELEI